MAELEKDGSMLTISVVKAVERTAIGDTAAEYVGNSSSFVIEATDAQKNKAVHEIIVANNRAPQSQGSLPEDFRIGEQATSTRDAKTGELIMALDALDNTGGVWEGFKCTQYNTCEFPLAAYFQDEDADGTLTFSAATKHAADAKYLSFTSMDGGIVIVGNEAKVDDADTGGVNESQVIVVLTATDPNGLKLPQDFTVNMESRPTAPATISGVTFKDVTASDATLTKTIVRSAANNFKDADDAYSTLTVTSKTSDKDVVAENGVMKGTGEDADNLILTIIGNRGSATATIVLTEPVDGTDGIGQFAETTIEVTAN
jgi:hypothetical protein